MPTVRIELSVDLGDRAATRTKPLSPSREDLAAQASPD
jgi:hypothetical protein